jgi:uncharacterized repeat protein (TIGR01451 family)
VTTSSTPDRVSVATARSTTYISYKAVLVNNGNSTLTHVRMSHALPPGTRFVRATTDRGACAASAPACELGNLPSRARATVEVTVTGPPAAGVIADVVTTSFSAAYNHGGDPKRTITSVQKTTVSATPGQASSWVPARLATKISTDPTGKDVATPTQTQIATAAIQAPGKGVLASLRRTAAPFSCPKGEVCRAGDWIEARALIDGVAAVFPTPLRFGLRWDKALVSPHQTTHNLAVFYKRELGAKLEVISRRCGWHAELPCLDDVRREHDGDFSAVLVQRHNGYMR